MSETQTFEIDPRLEGRDPPSTEGEPAPGDLELVRSFVNTRELDPDRDELTDPAALGAWIRARQIPISQDPTPGELERAIGFREGLRSLLLANAGAPLEPGALEALRTAATASPVEIQVDDAGVFATTPACDGVNALIAAILTAAASAQETGEWERLKVCTSDECLWAFYDRSRNHSRHWCSMEVCGNRAKTRKYRAKRSN